MFAPNTLIGPLVLLWCGVALTLHVQLVKAFAVQTTLSSLSCAGLSSFFIIMLTRSVMQNICDNTDGEGNIAFGNGLDLVRIYYLYYCV